MKKFFVTEEDTNLYNVFSVDDFDNDGYLLFYNGMDGYHISDFDVVYESNSFKDACKWIEHHSK